MSSVASVSAVSSSSVSTLSQPVYVHLAEAIRDLGSRVVFGVVSEDTIALVATLDAIGVEYCSARHEMNAVLAAEGYAAASGELGVAIIGRGPGVANAMNGIMNAHRSGSPVLVVAGEMERKKPGALGPDYKAFNAVGMLAAEGIRTIAVESAMEARSTLEAAAAEALTGKTVTLHIPWSIQSDEVANPPRHTPHSTSSAHLLPTVRQQSIDAAAAALMQAKRPLILAGVGAHRSGARETLEQLGDRIGALFLTTLKAKDFFRGNPFDLGILGTFSHSIARRLIQQADCIIVFGASLNWLTATSGTAIPAIPIIHVDARREHIGRHHPVDIGVWGDATAVAGSILEKLPERADGEKPFRAEAVRAGLAAFKPSDDIKIVRTDWKVDPRAMAMELDRHLPANRNLIYDCGNFFMVAGQIGIPNPSCLKHTIDFNSIGIGLGTAVGFAKARPDEVNVLLVGDGGLLMALPELETAARLNLSLLIVVMNDSAYGAEIHIGRVRNMAPNTSMFPDIDFAELATTLGYDTETVRSESDFERVAAWLAKPAGPMLLDCKINGAVIAPYISEFG